MSDRHALEPDRGDYANIFIQQVRGEIFSEGQFGDLSAEFCRDFKGKFCQPDGRSVYRVAFEHHWTRNAAPASGEGNGKAISRFQIRLAE
jgi:hypothetical protein